VTDRSEGDIQRVHRTTAALLSAVNSSDRDAVIAVWCDDGVLMPPHRRSVRGRSDIAEYFGQLFEQRRLRFDFTASQIEVDRDMAIERVEYTASAWPAKGGAEVRDAGKGVHVYRRQADGSWKLAMDIWNSDWPA
jgi:uncharacterized protein (TIGR02246 family)